MLLYGYALVKTKVKRDMFINFLNFHTREYYSKYCDAIY